MSEKSGNNINVESGGFWIAFAILAVFFYGDPDLHDVIIKWLSK